MTAIVGLVHDGRVYIGGDSAVTAGWHQTIRAQPKVHRSGPYVFGFCGSGRSAQLLRYAFTPPAPTVDLDAFMATTFTDAARTVLKDGGHAKKTEEQERNDGSSFLVGVNGRLFCVYSDYSYSESNDGYLAVGCGDEFALGALHATPYLPPKTRLTAALTAAAHFSAGVAGPFTIVSA